MGEVSKARLKELFIRIDRRLTKKVDIYIIGGASAILGYDVIKETSDVDIDGKLDSEFDSLFKEEVEALDLDLFLSARGVFTPPDGYKGRMKFEEFPRRNLRAWYLDQYNLAISKIGRGLEKDYADIQRVHKKSPYDCKTLISLFNDEYISVSAIGNKREKMMNLLDLILMLFGEEVLEESKNQVGFS